MIENIKVKHLSAGYQNKLYPFFLFFSFSYFCIAERLLAFMDYLIYFTFCPESLFNNRYTLTYHTQNKPCYQKLLSTGDFQSCSDPN